MAKKPIEPPETAAQRVANGVLVLDAIRPDWRKTIDKTKLDLASHVVCLLGQIFGDFDSGLEKLKMTKLEAFSYGFNTMSSKMEVELLAEWIRVIG